MTELSLKQRLGHTLSQLFFLFYRYYDFRIIDIEFLGSKTLVMFPIVNAKNMVSSVLKFLVGRNIEDGSG